VLSGYGVHWVFVEQRLPAEAPEFAAVRDRVEQDWRDERRAKFNDEFYAQLRARYEVVVEDDAARAAEGEAASEDATASEGEAASEDADATASEGEAASEDANATSSKGASSNNEVAAISESAQ
jgi:hypothetical protein